MMRRALLMGAAVLVLVGCSGSDTEGLQARLAAYEERLAELDARLVETGEGLERRLDQTDGNQHGLSVQYQEHYDDTVERLTALKEVFGELVEQQARQDLLIAGLQEYVERLGGQLARLQASRTAPARPVARAEPVPAPRPVAPAFDLTAIELRGGRSFVAVASHSAQSLNDVRLLEAGDSFAGWRVGRIGDRTAEFVSDSGAVELTVQ